MSQSEPLRQCSRTLKGKHLATTLIFLLACSSLSSLSQSVGEEDPDLRENPGERERFRRMQRADEHGEVPFGALERAKTQLDLMRSQQPSGPTDAGIGNWEPLGPGNIGGRIRAILIQPNNGRIWIGSVSGGIWRSDNGGDSWSPVNDFMASLAVTSIVMDPVSMNVLYASTGENGFGNADALPGAGIFKSIDGGITWSQLPATNNGDFSSTSRLAHHPSLSNTLLAVTNSGVRKTTDGGLTWPVVLNVANGTDARYNPSNPAVIAVGTSSGLFLSSDGGTTWQGQTTGTGGKLPTASGRCEVAFAPSNGSFLYTLINRGKGEIWRSTDGGSTWTNRTPPSSKDSVLGNQGWYANAIAVSPVDSNFVVVGGLNLWSSNDGGVTLTRLSYWPCYPNCIVSHSAHADQHIIVFDPGFDGSTNRNVFVGNDGGIQMAPDITAVGGALGNGWVSLANNLSITQFYAGATSPTGDFIIGGAQDNSTLRYRGDINNWYQWATGDGGFCAIDFSYPSIAYEEYIFLQIRKSVDGGNIYSPATNGLRDADTAANALFIAPFSMDPNNSTNLVAGGLSIWKTDNAATAWASIRDPLSPQTLCSAIDIANGNPSTIWVGYANGTVSFTSDGGISWTNADANPPGLPNRFVTDIAINPINPNEVFVTFGGYATTDIWMTTNSGATWQLRQGTGAQAVPALQVNTVRYHPADPNWVYVGTDLGVFASEDKGVTWNTTPLFAENEGPVNVEVDELFWQGSEYLIAATHGRGMFRCRPLSTVFVDSSYAGAEDGSEFKPYNTVREGIDASGNGTTISIKKGTYLESHPIIFSKRSRIRATNGTVIVK